MRILSWWWSQVRTTAGLECALECALTMPWDYHEATCTGAMWLPARTLPSSELSWYWYDP